MNTLSFVLIMTGLGVVAGALIWLAVSVGSLSRPGPEKNSLEALGDEAQRDVEHLFNEEFREELRNRGRLHFEKIIGENAMFLQQDLRLTTSQLNEYMKTEITTKLQEEFTKYEQSITDAKQMAVESITKTQEVIDQQRQAMDKQLHQEMADEKQRMIQRFESNMAAIVNHYVLIAIGDQIDLNDQLEFILADLESHKTALVQDLHNGS